MFVSAASRLRFVLGLMVLSLLFVSISSAQSTGSLHGKGVDTLGTPIPGCDGYTASSNNKEIIHVQADADGVFKLDVAATGRYVPQIEAKGFQHPNFSSSFSGIRQERRNKCHVAGWPADPADCCLGNRHCSSRSGKSERR